MYPKSSSTRPIVSTHQYYCRQSAVVDSWYRMKMALRHVSSCHEMVVLCAGGAGHLGKSVTLFGDIVEKVCCHPAYRLLRLRALPQMPASSVDFTTFTWPAILRRLRQMQATGVLLAVWAASGGQKLTCMQALESQVYATWCCIHTVSSGEPLQH